MDNNYETFISLCRKDKENLYIQIGLKAVDNNSGWKEFTRTAKYHGLLPFIYGELENKFKSFVLGKIFSQIKDHYLQTTINNINIQKRTCQNSGGTRKQTFRC